MPVEVHHADPSIARSGRARAIGANADDGGRAPGAVPGGAAGSPGRTRPRRVRERLRPAAARSPQAHPLHARRRRRRARLLHATGERPGHLRHRARQARPDAGAARRPARSVPEATGHLRLRPRAAAGARHTALRLRVEKLGGLRPPSEPPPRTQCEPQDGHGLGPVRPRPAPPSASRRTATGWAPCVRGEHPETAPAKPALERRRSDTRVAPEHRPVADHIGWMRSSGTSTRLTPLKLNSSSTRYPGGSEETCCTTVPSAFWTFWLKWTPLMVRFERSTLTRWLGSSMLPPFAVAAPSF